MKSMSKKNPYYLPVERRLELKYFCRQYPRWQAEYNNCVVLPGAVPEKEKVDHTLTESDVEKIAEKREVLKNNMDMVIDASKKCSDDFGKYIFRGATTGLSYDRLVLKMYLPLNKRTYCELMQKFFYILDKTRK